MSIAELVADIEKERDAWKSSAEFANQKVGEVAADRDSLHRSYQGKVDELKYVREQFDKHKADFGHLPREVQRLTADRDQWKARAEKAEARIAELEGIVGDKDALVEDLKRQIGNVRQERNSYEARCLEQINEIGELMDRLRDRPSTLEAVLEELAGDASVRFSVRKDYDQNGFRVELKLGDLSHVGYFDHLDDIAGRATRSAIELIPDSAFARRRREEKEKDDSSEAIAEMFKEYPRPWKFDVAGNLSDANGELIDDSANLGIMHAVNAYSPQPTPEPAPSPSQQTPEEPGVCGECNGRGTVMVEENTVTSCPACSKPAPEPTPGFPREFAQKVAVVQEEVQKSPPSQPDIVAELLSEYAGEWRVGEQFSQLCGDLSGWWIESDKDQVGLLDWTEPTNPIALCELVNRYRKVLDAHNRRLAGEIGHTVFDREIFSALRPLVMEAKG